MPIRPAVRGFVDAHAGGAAESMSERSVNTLEYSAPGSDTPARRVVPWLDRLAFPWAMCGVLLVGIACRLAQYFSNRSFWVDESMIVLNIRGKTAAQLLSKLDFNQAAPPLFLLAERLLYRTFGGSEFSLRLLPLACSIAALLLFEKLARRLCSPPWAWLAVALMALSDRLIWHASEVKPYSGDVLAAVMLILIATGRGDGRCPVRRMVRLSIGAAILAWFSYPSTFIFGGASLGIGWEIIRRDGRHGRAIALWLLGNLLVMVSFVLLVHFSVQQQETSGLSTYWAGNFLDLRHPLGAPNWIARRVFSACTYACAPAGPLILGCGIVGFVALWRERRVAPLLALFGPLCLLIVAAAAKRYPFEGARLTVFLAPELLLLTAIGIDAIERRGAALVQWIGIGAAGALICIAGGLAIFHLAVPRMRGHVRPAVKFVISHSQSGDGIYTLNPHEFECYWPTPAATDPRVRYEIDRADRVPFRRFWIVVAFPNQTQRHRLEPLLKWARGFATMRESFIGLGGAAWLFEKSGAGPVEAIDPPHDNKERRGDR